MLQRTLFEADHEAFRDSFRKFVEREVAPPHAAWEEQGYVDRQIWHRAGELGFLCMTLPENLGGLGVDRRFSVIQFEELSRAGCTGIGWSLHSEIVAPYIAHYGTPEQQARLLPAMVRGDIIGAIAMSEPAAGSDLQGIKTTATAQPDGSWLLNGSKTFITNGWHADVVIVVAKTQPDAGAKGISLFLVERGMPGFDKGQRLKKLGLKAQDTSELFFNNVRLGAEHLLGGMAQLNQGFAALMTELPWERLQIAITAVAAAQAAIEQTVAYVKDRKVFGTTVGQFQNTRYTLAELQTEVQIAQVFVDRCVQALLQGELSTTDASMAKYWCSDLQCKVMDACVQLHGGYGYMWEYPITRAYADARVQRIYGGTNEIMKELISRSMGLGGR
jgi:alkylation response protein AidB-like acyl-CoA dehydrogenase